MMKSKQILTTPYTLSIRLGADGFSFSVHDPLDYATFSYYPLEIEPGISLTANMRRLLASNEMLQGNFKRVDVLLDTSAYTTVPFELFEDEQAECIYEHCLPLRRGECVLYDIMDRSNAVVLYAMDRTAYQLLSEYYPEFHLYATVTPVIEHLANKNRVSGTRRLYLRIHGKSVSLVAFERSHLLMGVTYSCYNVEDIAYYVMNAWSGMGFNPETDELYIVGEEDRKQEVAERLQRFLNKVAVVTPVAEFNRSTPARMENLPYDMLTLIHGNLL